MIVMFKEAIDGELMSYRIRVARIECMIESLAIVSISSPQRRIEVDASDIIELAADVGCSSIDLEIHVSSDAELQEKLDKAGFTVFGMIQAK